ncbi:MAG: hypothetical protein RQ714_08610 [Nitrosomonas sp.]|nr:hypothetical protein [Nitrosomonas sp.]
MNHPQSNDPLISLLTGMPDVPEAEFCERVLDRLQAQALRRKVAFLIAWCCAIAGIALRLPLERLLNPLPLLTQKTEILWAQYATAEPLSSFTQALMSNTNLLVVFIAGALVLLISSTVLMQE